MQALDSAESTLFNRNREFYEEEVTGKRVAAGLDEHLILRGDGASSAPATEECLKPRAKPVH